jgi:hypothetical protein
MANNNDTLQAIKKATISHLAEIRALKQKLIDFQNQVEQKDNELIKAQKEIIKLKEQLKAD